MFRAVVVLIAFLSAACSPQVGDHSIDITHDPCEVIVVEAGVDTTPDERQSIDDAIAMWARAAGTKLTQTPTADSQTLPVLFQDAAPAFHGLYDDKVGVVLINQRISDRHERAVTLAHELGHAFGLLHIESGDRSSVMNSGNLDIEPNEGDALALSELWGECPDAPRLIFAPR